MQNGDFEMMEKYKFTNDKLIEILFAVFLLGLINIPAFGQEKVSGKVTDAQSDNSLPGVNILVKGTTIGTSTDQRGNFELTVPSLQDTLVVSFIGYLTQEVPINGRTEIDVALESQVVSGDEVVVIGYGTVEKRDVTGSVSQVEAEKISNTSVPRLDQALQGKSSGVRVTSVSGEPGSETSIRIRGGNSISASNEPLYVIDGFIGGGDLNSINPSDIESIEILKDASATAIYGSRGANGVILVTTKQGRQGEVQVNIKSSIGWQEVDDKIELLTGPERAQYANETAEVTGETTPFPNLDEVEHYDWIDEVIKVAPVRSMDLSVSGGSETTQYFLSGNYRDQEGIVKNSGFTRFQSRLNVKKQVKEWFDINTQLNISRTNQANNTLSMGDVIREAHTFIPFYQDDGSYTVENPRSGFPFSNPIAQVQLPEDKTFRTRFQGNVAFELRPNQIENLEIISRLGVDLNSNKRNRFQPGTMPLRQDQQLGAFGRVDGNNSWNILSETTISYEAQINEDNRFNIMGGATFQHNENESMMLSADNIPSDALSFNSLEIGDPSNRNINTGFTDWTLLSYLSRLNYTFRDRYLLTLTSRADGSSRLAENNKWVLFPSAAFAWQLGDEPFIQNLDFFTDLKLRASFGKTGNQAIGIYESLSSLDQGTVFLNESEHVIFRQGNVANPDLKWETTKQLDLGLDASILNNRLSFTLDYYYKVTEDLLLRRELPFQTGFQNRLINIGEVENKGLEFSVDARLVQQTDFAWDIKFNISGNRNKVLDLGGNDFIDLGTGSRLVVGEVGASFAGVVLEDLWTQDEIDADPDYMPGARPGFPRFEDVNGNGTFDDFGDAAIIGDFQADFFGGFSNTLQYKNFALDTDVQFTYGNDIMNVPAQQLFYGRFQSNVGAVARDRWTPENTDTDIPRAGSELVIDYRLPSSAGVHDGSFLRLKNLRFEYEIPTEKIRWLGVNNRARIYFTGTNLVTWDSYEYGWDPEVNARGTNPVEQGFDDFSTYPTAKTYAIGIHYEF